MSNVEKNFFNFKNKVLDQESKVLAIDFDGVIHKNSKGFHDGTIYDDIVEGTSEAIKKLSKEFKIIIFSCKALPDRPLVDNKTGIELIWEWLKKNNIDSYVEEVTYKKPRAVYYIDDKAIRFENWQKVVRSINEKE